MGEDNAQPASFLFLNCLRIEDDEISIFIAMHANYFADEKLSVDEKNNAIKT